MWLQQVIRHSPQRNIEKDISTSVLRLYVIRSDKMRLFVVISYNAGNL